MPTAYVSSTFSDLQDHRKRIALALSRLRLSPVAMEAYVADTREPVEKCLADVRACDLYIGVFAWRHGSCPPGESRSFTELEYREAVAAGRPRLIFLLDEDAPWPRSRMDKDASAIERLRAELQAEVVVSVFSDE